MIHETHCKFRGSWRWPGVGSTGILFRGWKVEGDPAPIGGKCVRAEVVYFIGGERWLSGFWKVAQVFGLRCTYGFPRADPVRRYSDVGVMSQI